MKKVSIATVILIIIVGILFVFRDKKPKAQEQSASKTNATLSPTQIPVNSAENAPSGSLHNLPIPTPVAVARKEAAKLLGIPESHAIIMTAFEMEWPDGCLGLPKNDEMCTQAIINGYEVTVRGNGKEVIFRTNHDGSVIRLQK